MSKKAKADESGLYCVRSADGKYLRKKGFMGSGNCWVDKFALARIYTRPGPAKGQVTWWTKNYPDREPPVVVRLIVTGEEVIPTDKAGILAKAAREKAAKEERQLRYEQEALERRRLTLEQQQEELHRRRMQRGL